MYITFLVLEMSYYVILFEHPMALWPRPSWWTHRQAKTCEYQLLRPLWSVPQEMACLQPVELASISISSGRCCGSRASLNRVSLNYYESKTFTAYTCSACPSPYSWGPPLRCRNLTNNLGSYVCQLDLIYKGELLAVANMAKVEVCAGEGQLSLAIRDAGFHVKPFDVSWPISLWIPTSPKIHQPIKSLTVVMGLWLQVRYSGNHNILRTTGLLTLLALVIFSVILLLCFPAHPNTPLFATWLG